MRISSWWRTKFQLEILTTYVIFGFAYFREIILESLRNVSGTTAMPFREPRAKGFLNALLHLLWPVLPSFRGWSWVIVLDYSVYFSSNACILTHHILYTSYQEFEKVSAEITAKVEHCVWTRFLVLTHWGRLTHICVSKLTIIGSDNGLSPGRHQAIIWTNAGILLISVKSQQKCIHFHSRKCIWKCRLENSGHFVSASMC